VKKSQKNKSYIPEQQDIIVLDFDPALGQEIKKRRPALVLSNQGYSRLTGLVVIAPITNAKNNALRDSGFLVPIHHQDVNGFINPLQFYTYDYSKRNAKFIGILNTPAFIEVKQTVLHILD
jgi:mRNA interferase MazF